MPYRLLEAVPELSSGDPDTENMLIQGDNLQALKTLLPLYAGKVKYIYIDPLGRWRPIPMTAQERHATPDQFYEVITPSGKVHRPPEGRCWGGARATYEKPRINLIELIISLFFIHRKIV